MKVYNLKSATISNKEYLVTDNGTLFLENLSDIQLKKLGYLRVVEEEYNSELEELSYKELDGVWQGVKVDRKDKEEVLKKRAYEAWKIKRANAIKNLEVTIDKAKRQGSDTIDNGVIFQGDEVSQNRLTRAISVANSVSLQTTAWVAKDNTVYELTGAQLAEILIKALEKQSELWNKDRPEDVTGE